MVSQRRVAVPRVVSTGDVLALLHGVSKGGLVAPDQSTVHQKELGGCVQVVCAFLSGRSFGFRMGYSFAAHHCTAPLRAVSWTTLLVPQVQSQHFCSAIASCYTSCVYKRFNIK
jgi:hypothetical protein